METWDLLVIGAGPGGYTAALHAAKCGLKTTVIEAREAGGTCLNRGCVPTKTLLHTAEVYRSAKEGAAIGVVSDGLHVDLNTVFARKRQVVETLSKGVEALLKSAKVPLLHGTAKITAPHTVSVTASDGTETIYQAESILIATGSVPARPPIPGLTLDGVMTSDELLEGADALYRSIVIIGGGVIGVELATFYADLGSEVTIVEGLDRLLPTMDREIGQNLALLLKKQGVRIVTGAMVERIEPAEDGLSVVYTQKGAEGSAAGEKVLCAIGRHPYCDGLFADGLQPETERRRIRVDERFHTSIPGIYAIGDVSSPVQLAHVAAAQGIACVDGICGNKPSVDLSIIPACIYTRPEIACVGLTEAEAKEQNIPVKIGKCVMGANARTMIADPGRSFMKITAHAETGKILGAVLMCANATDMISEISSAIANGLTVKQLLRSMRPHPTFNEALTDALSDAERKRNQ